ncbi:MAG TPA: PRC-barrel domain-containing protein [Alphaproteobacteria bacterium]|nr:PRC-barrel domain-containing protein [Alphaproteobacteria bacterium]
MRRAFPLLLAAGLAAATAATAAETGPRGPAAAPAAPWSEGELRGWIGRTVADASGAELGLVQDIVTAGGGAPSAIVLLEDGAGSRRVAIPVDSLSTAGHEGALIATLPAPAIAELPDYLPAPAASGSGNGSSRARTLSPQIGQK